MRWGFETEGERREAWEVFAGKGGGPASDMVSRIDLDREVPHSDMSDGPAVDCSSCNTDTPISDGADCGSGGRVSGGRWVAFGTGCFYEYVCRDQHACEDCGVEDFENIYRVNYGGHLLQTCREAAGGSGGCDDGSRVVYDNATGRCYVEAHCRLWNTEDGCEGAWLGWHRTLMWKEGCAGDAFTTTEDWIWDRRDPCSPPPEWLRGGLDRAGAGTGEFKSSTKEKCPRTGVWWTPGLPPKGLSGGYGCIDNRSGQVINIWWSGQKGAAMLAADQSTCLDTGDIDHVRDTSGQWWKLADGITAVVTDSAVAFVPRPGTAKATPPLEGRDFGKVTTCGANFGE